MRILFLLDFYPFPEDKDGKTKILANIFKRLPSSIQFDVITVTNEDHYREKDDGIIIKKATSNSAFKKKLNRFLLLPINAFSTKKLKKILDGFDLGTYDIIHTAHDSFINMHKLHPAVLVGLNDSYSLAVNSRSWKGKIKKLYFRLLERNLGNKNLHFILVSSVDAAKFPSSKTLSLPNGVDTSKYKPVNCTKIKDSFVFHGVLDFAPNMESITYMSGFIKLINPNAKLYVVGRLNRMQPGEFMDFLSGLSNTVYVGEVENISEEICKYEFYISLMVSGAGIKNKVLEALASNCKIIMNEKTAEGFENQNELKKIAYIIKNDEDGSTISSGLNSIHLLHDQGNAYVKNNYSWDTYVDKLIWYYKTLLNDQIK